MHASTRAIIWYFWHRARWNTLLFAAASVSFALIIRTGQAGRLDDLGSSNLIVQIILLAVFSVALFTGRGTWSGLPNPYLVTLPVTTRRCLAVAYGFQIVIVVGACAAVIAIHLALFGTSYLDDPYGVGMAFWQIPLFCVALGCLAHGTSHLGAIKKSSG